jgi:hypothetical protein
VDQERGRAWLVEAGRCSRPSRGGQARPNREAVEIVVDVIARSDGMRASVLDERRPG